MATLAEHPNNKGIRLEDPFKQYQKRLEAATPALKEKRRKEAYTKEAEEKYVSEEDEDYNKLSSDSEAEDEEAEEHRYCEESEEEEIPKSAKKKKPSSTNGLSSQLASLRIGPPIQTISGILGYSLENGKSLITTLTIRLCSV